MSLAEPSLPGSACVSTTERAAKEPTAPAGATGGLTSTDLTERVRLGDRAAIVEVLLRHRERIRRIVSIRLAVRLARILDEEELPECALRAALLGLGDEHRTNEPDLVRILAQVVEREVRRRGDVGLGETGVARRTLRFDDLQHARRVQREDLERIVDARVAALEPAECREVLILRDYCGASWNLVRACIGALSVEAVQELYRRAHERLTRILPPSAPRARQPPED